MTSANKEPGDKVEAQMAKEATESFFQRFVMRTKPIRKSPSSLVPLTGQPRPGLLTTLFGNPLQIFKKKQTQTGPLSMFRQPSYATTIGINHCEEAHDFEECDEFATTAMSPAPAAVGNGTAPSGGNNFYRPPRSYQSRACVISTHNDVFDLPKHALKSEVRVLSAPSKQHPKLPPTPPRSSKFSSTASPPMGKKHPHGAPPRKISAPAGPPSRMMNHHVLVTKKTSVAGTAPVARREMRPRVESCRK